MAKNITLTGAEFKDFYADSAIWSTDAYHDDTVIYVNGVQDDGTRDLAEIADDDVVTVEDGGVIMYPTHNGGEEVKDFCSVLKKWLKMRTTTTFLVTVDKQKMEAVKAAIKQAGGTVK